MCEAAVGAALQQPDTGCLTVAVTIRLVSFSARSRTISGFQGLVVDGTRGTSRIAGNPFSPPATDSTPPEVPNMFLDMEQADLFPDPRPSVHDEEIVAAIRGAISNSGRLSRLADLYLNTVCADHLVRELRVAGLVVVRAMPEWPSE